MSRNRRATSGPDYSPSPGQSLHCSHLIGRAERTARGQWIVSGGSIVKKFLFAVAVGFLLSATATAEEPPTTTTTPAGQPTVTATTPTPVVIGSTVPMATTYATAA